MKKKSIAMLSRAVAFVGVGVGLAPFAKGVVSVTSETGPTATFTGANSNAVNFTTEGSYAWVYWPTNSANGVSTPPYEKAGNASAFTPLVSISSTGALGTVTSGRATIGTGATAAVTTTDSNTTDVTGLAGYTYLSETSPAATGVGM